MHVLFTLPLQSLKIIFVKNTLVLLAVVAKGVDWGRVGLKKSTPYHNFRAICIILLLRKKSLPEFKILTKTLLLVHLFAHVLHEQRDPNAQWNNRKLFLWQSISKIVLFYQINDTYNATPQRNDIFFEACTYFYPFTQLIFNS